jgi:hypothetical protein
MTSTRLLFFLHFSQLKKIKFFFWRMLLVLFPVLCILYIFHFFVTCSDIHIDLDSCVIHFLCSLASYQLWSGLVEHFALLLCIFTNFHYFSVFFVEFYLYWFGIDLLLLFAGIDWWQLKSQIKCFFLLHFCGFEYLSCV